MLRRNTAEALNREIPPTLLAANSPRLLRRAEIVVVGKRRAANQVVRRFRSEGTEVEMSPDVDSALRAISESTKTTILTLPLRGERADLACAALTTRGKALYVLRSSGTAEALFEKMSKAGADAVFSWPAERESLIRAATRVCAAEGELLQKPELAADIALEEIVRQRLRSSETNFGGKVSVRVRNHLAILFGRTDRRPKVALAKKIASTVHGVEKAISAGLQVETAD